MEPLIEFYRNAFEGLRDDPEGYFKTEYPLLNDKMVHALFFGGWLFYFIVAGFAAGGLFGSALSTAAALIFLPVPIVLTMVLGTGYVLVFCNLFFGKPTSFQQVWRLFVVLGAITVPVTLLSAILGFVPIIGSLASLTLAILTVYVSYLGCRHVLELSLPQFLILHVPPIVLGVGAAVFYFAAMAALQTSYTNLSNVKVPPAIERSSDWKEFKENEDFAKNLSAKQTAAREATSEDGSTKKKKAKDTKKGVTSSVELRAGDAYIFSFAEKNGKKMLSKGTISVKVRREKVKRAKGSGKADSEKKVAGLQVTVITKVGKKTEKETITLKKGASHSDLFAELSGRLTLKPKRKVDRYEAVMTMFLEAQTGASLAKDHSANLKKVSGSFGLTGSAVAEELPKPSGKAKIAGRSGREYKMKNKDAEIRTVRDASLGLPLLSYKEKRGVRETSVRLKKFKGGKS